MNDTCLLRVLVLGLGHSGLALARWYARLGAQVTVADTRAQPPQLAALHQALPQAQFVCAAMDAALLQSSQATLVLRSPGLAPAQWAALAAAAQAQGVAVLGELDVFTQALAQLQAQQGYAPSVLAVTGTNGKTTVTALTGQLLARAGLSVAVAGNIGPTMLDTLSTHIDTQSLPQVWVLELSSFQLHGVHGFEPTAAALLNLTQDHLDWHGDMAQYAQAKARIFGKRTLRVLQRDDPQVMALHQATTPSKGKGVALPAWVTFGAGLPQRPGDYGIEDAQGVAWLVRALPEDNGRKPKASAPAEMVLQRLMPADALRLRGRHNATNALAALALAQAAGAALAPMLYGLREYRGEPHRVQSLGVVQDVEYFDDSKGTNIGATVAALHGLGTQRKLVVILGGDGKGQDFSDLAAPVARYARAVVLIGRDAGAIRQALHNTGVVLIDASTLPEAVQLASAQAQAGDAVLLSPACASFDMFDNYGHRARVFCDAVVDLAQQAGSVLEVMA